MILWNAVDRGSAMVRYNIQNSFDSLTKGLTVKRPRVCDNFWAKDERRLAHEPRFIASQKSQYPIPSFFGGHSPKSNPVREEQISIRPMGTVARCSHEYPNLLVLYGRNFLVIKREVPMSPHFVLDKLSLETLDVIAQPSGCTGGGPLFPDLKSLRHFVLLSSSSSVMSMYQSTQKLDIPSTQKPEEILPLNIFTFSESFLHADLLLSSLFICVFWLVLFYLYVFYSDCSAFLKRNIKAHLIFCMYS